MHTLLVKPMRPKHLPSLTTSLAIIGHIAQYIHCHTDTCPDHFISASPYLSLCVQVYLSYSYSFPVTLYRRRCHKPGDRRWHSTHGHFPSRPVLVWIIPLSFTLLYRRVYWTISHMMCTCIVRSGARSFRRRCVTKKRGRWAGRYWECQNAC